MRGGGLAKIPAPLDHSNVELALRNLGRYIKRAEKVVLNVANGEFPGKY
jgi:hypothetical protein